MYNFFVSARAESWNGDPWQVDLDRCVREYTDTNITAKFGELDETAISVLKRLPCIFAYEAANSLDPKFGVIRNIVKRQGQVRLEYDLLPIDPFLSAQELEQGNCPGSRSLIDG